MIDNSILAKFSVGDKVMAAPGTCPSLANVEWRGDWCQLMNGGFNDEDDLEIMDFFSDIVVREGIFTITDVLVREENSLNGIRREVYYKLEGQGDKCFREDLMVAVDDAHPKSIILSENDWRPGMCFSVKYSTSVATRNVTPECRSVAILREYDSIKEEPNGVTLAGAMRFTISGIWYAKDYIVHELHKFDEMKGTPNVYMLVDREGNMKFAFTANTMACVGIDAGNAASSTPIPFNLANVKVFSFKEFIENMNVEGISEFDTDY